METREVCFFVGTSFACGEVTLSVEELKRWSDALTVGNKAHSTVQMKLAAEQISKIAGQVKALADIVVRTSTERLNRRAAL